MDGFCRGCLIRYYEPSELLLYTEKIRRLFIYSTGIQVNHDDAATFQLCKDCYVNMKMSCKFKKQCRISDKKFKHYLSLKEAGDAFEFSTYIRNNDDSLKFPSLSRQSTPAPHRSGDDDNESTCTSIRNFMTDILQGEEVPDNEARIIKEVIEEQTDILDDSLDSHWLQDDVSIDTDFRLDFSFSPLSTPHSTNHNVCYTPNKQFEVDSNNFNKESKKIIELPIEYDTNKNHDFNEEHPLQDKLPNEDDKSKDDSNHLNSELNHDLINESTEPEDVFEDIHQNVNYLAHSENDIAVRNLLQSNNQDDSMQTESLYAVKVLRNEASPIHQSDISDENMLEQTDNIVDNDQNNYEIHDGNQFTQKYIDNNVNNNQGNISLTIQNGNEVIIKIGEPNKDSNHFDEQSESNVNMSKEKHHTVDTPVNQAGLNIKINNNTLLNEESKDITSSKNVESPYDMNHEDKHGSKDEKLEDVYKSEENQLISLDDLLNSHSEYNLGPGASTPTINNIIFGDKLDSDEDSNKLDKIADKLSIQSGGTDILDKMLKHGVKEFQIDTPSPKVESIYDIANSHCNSCDKTFKNTTALKIHLVRKHNVRVPHIKNRNFDFMVRTCEVCGEVLKHFASFQKHMKTHEGYTHQCTKCKLRFSSKNKLKSHMKCHVPIQDVKKLPSKESKKIVCTICGREYLNSGNFSLHMKRHNQDYVATCNQCGKGYYRKSDLINHLRLHSGEKPFSCEYCEMRFRIRYALVKHVRVHLAEKHFQCAHCDKKYVLRSDLVYHLKHSASCMQARAGLKPKRKKVPRTYICYYCRDTFLNKKDFVRHQKNFRPCEKMHDDPAYMNNRIVELPILYVENSEEMVRLKQEEESENEDVDIFEI